MPYEETSSETHPSLQLVATAEFPPQLLQTCVTNSELLSSAFSTFVPLRMYRACVYPAAEFSSWFVAKRAHNFGLPPDMYAFGRSLCTLPVGKK